MKRKPRTTHNTLEAMGRKEEKKENVEEQKNTAMEKLYK